ncbi:MAG TPA: nucleotidyltransferase family protein [Tepidisphaeraceae bacterium]|nr:nucleotidyltransferase family protein [Tepidisphaeraceae bacterium]
MNDPHSIPAISTIPVALLAGGMAARLGVIAQQTPKALVDVNGRAFIDHQLGLLHRYGVRRVVLCLGHLGGKIEEHLGDGSRIGMSLRYSHDGARLVGTGGAVRRALPMLGELFWVMYGDSYMDIDYAEVLRRFCSSQSPRAARGLMTLIRNENRWDKSNAIFQNGRLTCYDKRNRSEQMQYIDYGIQLLRREAFDTTPAGGAFDLADLYRDLVTRGEMIGHEVFNRFYEIGTPQSLEETRRYLQSASRVA